VWVMGSCAQPVTDVSGVTPASEAHRRSLPLRLWANSCHVPRSKGYRDLFDKVVGANGTLEKEEGPPGLGDPPSTCSWTYLFACVVRLRLGRSTK
jgi:hypothetical protein